MRLDITPYTRENNTKYWKVWFSTDDHDHPASIPGPLIIRDRKQGSQNIWYEDEIVNFANSIIDDIVSGKIDSLSSYAGSNSLRFNKADGKIMCRDREIGSICFSRVFSYYSYDFFGDDDMDNAFRFNGYRVGHTSSQSWRIEHCADHIIYVYIATVPDTEDINTILDLIVANMNCYPNNKGGYELK